MDKFKTVCLNCGAVNAFPVSAEGKKVVCGRCRMPLPRPGEVLEPAEEGALEKLLLNPSLPVLVDFYSNACPPCRVMHPVIERLAGRRRGEILVTRVDVERHPGLASKFGIQATPTFVILNRGYEIARTTGASSESEFSLWAAGAAR
ncbi:MAG: thioredoxin fold domain-containing protein [Candidatus Aminicenantes bacterium]|nr:thioredoxin fold domain-containing protein [Candidatus Aminicenantes bacterium]